MIHFRKLGSGPPIVILHGLYGMSDNWMGIARQLADKNTIIIADLRNHGHSFHSDVHNYDVMSSDLLELVDELKLPKIKLIGHSMGGKAAIHFACKYPERLAGLMVLDIAPVNYDNENSHFSMHYSILQNLMDIDINHIESREQAFEILITTLPDEKLVKFLLKNLGRDSEGKFYWLMNLESLYKSLPVIAGGFDHFASREPITGFPVYFLKGEKSHYISDEGFSLAQRVFPVAELIHISNAGHWLHQENPDEVIRAIKNWLNE